VKAPLEFAPLDHSYSRGYSHLDGCLSSRNTWPISHKPYRETHKVNWASHCHRYGCLNESYGFIAFWPIFLAPVSRIASKLIVHVFSGRKHSFDEQIDGLEARISEMIWIHQLQDLCVFFQAWRAFELIFCIEWPNMHSQLWLVTSGLESTRTSTTSMSRKGQHLPTWKQSCSWKKRHPVHLQPLFEVNLLYKPFQSPGFCSSWDILVIMCSCRLESGERFAGPHFAEPILLRQRPKRPF